MLQSKTFINRLLRNSTFTRRLMSIIIDEVHCMSHWGTDFQKKYGTLGMIHAFLQQNTPVIAVTATHTYGGTFNQNSISQSSAAYIRMKGMTDQMYPLLFAHAIILLAHTQTLILSSQIAWKQAQTSQRHGYMLTISTQGTRLLITWANY